MNLSSGPRSLGLTNLARYRVSLRHALEVLTIVSLGPLLALDALPKLFPARAHDPLAALPLAWIAVAYVIRQFSSGATRRELAKAFMLAAAFLFWAANQLWSDHPLAVLFNDIAIALFVLDVLLAMMGWPSSAGPDAPAADPLESAMRAEGRTASSAGLGDGVASKTLEPGTVEIRD